ncbi:mucin-2 [Anopheles ziemanni]|uniref:mucin-2 n=1 Tax=Anopheles coustani TaxID=139045 RepID=UPI002658A303|nr:mucin-2 [Anopheles coustani]XP_058169568.1 mucin-2 [Anopheles ziemanni]
MSSQIPPLVCHTPPPIDFDDADDDADDYGPEDIPDDDGIDVDDNSRADCLEDDFGDFATVPPMMTPKLIPGEPVIEKETEEVTSIPGLAETKGTFVPRVGNDSPPSLILPTANVDFDEDDEEAVSGTVDEEDYDFQPFGCPSQPPEPPPPEDSVSLPSLHFDADTSKSEDDDHVPTHPNPSSATGSGIETEVDLPAVAVPTTAERTTPVIQEGGRFDDNTENDFTDFTTASNERSSVVLEIPTANDVSFELDDYAQLESTPSADSNFVSQQSRTDFATFDADFSKFDSFQASFPATVDDPVVVKTPLEEAKSMPNVEQQASGKNQSSEQGLPEDDFDDFQEFATFSEQPVASKSANISLAPPTTSFQVESTKDACSEVAVKSEMFNSAHAKPINDPPADEDDDDFGEFSDFKQSAFSNPPIASVPSFSLENVHSLLETMFPSINPEPFSSDTGQLSAVGHSIPHNSLHSQLQDFDNTSALTYQYSKSTSSKALVTALGIDSRNIMYGPKWNSSMPRFAANLSFNPLEPLKPDAMASKDSGSAANEKHANASTIASKVVGPMVAGLDPLQPTIAPSSSSVPAVQFDWNSSGLVNPLEASHAHTLLLDLEQLEVMASLNDKINVDSSSYPPALRSTSYVANTVQLPQCSPTTPAATTSTTITTPLLLSPTLPRTSPPSPPPPLPPQPQQPPIQPSTAPTTLLLASTNHTQTYRPNQQHGTGGNNVRQSQTKIDANCSITAGTDVNPLRAPLDCTIALLSFADDRDLLISTSTTTPTTPIEFEFTPTDNIITHTSTPLLMPPPVGMMVIGNTCPLLSGTDRITDRQLVGGFELMAPGAMHHRPEPTTTTSASVRAQSFDDYLDLSVQEMLQKATTGQPADGPKGEILDPEIPEDTGATAADDIAVMAAVPASAVPPPSSHLEDDDDVRSLDFTANVATAAAAIATAGSSNVQHATTLPHANQEPGPVQHYPSPPPQQQPMSISTSPNNVPLVRTIKLQETHIFTPSRGGTPVSRDITDRDIVVREYHDVEYSLDKPSATTAAGIRKEPDFDEFNDFQSVPVNVPPSAIPGPMAASYARPVIGHSPTEELEDRSVTAPNGGKRNGAEDPIASEDDDFTEFQAATIPPPAPIPTGSASQPVNKSVSNVQQHNRSNTSSPVMLLSPAILLPQQASTPASGKDAQHSRSGPQSMSQINWPEPGIDPDELARFEAAFAKPASSKAPATRAVPAAGVPKADSNQSVATSSKPISSTEEDEWTDFISSKPMQTSVPPKASATTNQQKAPDTSSATPSSSVAQEEWTDFISSTPTTAGFTSHNRLSSSQNNFNYSRPPAGGAGGVKAAFNSWNQPQLPPPQFSSWNSNSLYYNPMSSLAAATGQQQSLPYHQQYAGLPPQQQFYGRPDNNNAGGASRVPTHPAHHHHHAYHQHHQAGIGGLPQQPQMHLLPELSFITPNAAAGPTGTAGAKPATHSFLSNVISSNSFTKK